MDFEYFFASAVMIGVGLIAIFKRDWVWKWYVKSMRFRGIKEEILERTREWDMGYRILGIILLVMGISGMILPVVLSVISFIIR